MSNKAYAWYKIDPYTTSIVVFFCENLFQWNLKLKKKTSNSKLA